jgi:hypothetical protein
VADSQRLLVVVCVVVAAVVVVGWRGRVRRTLELAKVEVGGQILGELKWLRVGGQVLEGMVVAVRVVVAIRAVVVLVVVVVAAGGPDLVVAAVVLGIGRGPEFGPCPHRSVVCASSFLPASGHLESGRRY